MAVAQAAAAGSSATGTAAATSARASAVGEVGDAAVPRAGASTTRIHVGSCSDTHEEQPFWEVLSRRKGDAFFWGGDIVYGDDRATADLSAGRAGGAVGGITPATRSVLDGLYAMQSSRRDYADYIGGLRVVDGIWDDHDFGVDNGHSGSFDAATKDSHKAALLDFLGAPGDDERRAPGRGAFTSRRVDDVDVILLDARYDRQRGGGALLGDAQWAWLRAHLAAARDWARATVIISPIQLLATGERPPPAEGWFQYPDERAALVQALADANVSAPFVVSGDVHYAEMAAYTCRGTDGATATVAELTTSGLSHAWGSPAPAHYDSRAFHRLKHLLAPGPRPGPRPGARPLLVGALLLVVAPLLLVRHEARAATGWRPRRRPGTVRRRRGSRRGCRRIG